jgi:peroxiredoxin
MRAFDPAADTVFIAPDFERPTIQGGTLHLSSHLGSEVVVLNFWAPWCRPCRAEISGFVQLQKHYGADRVRFVGVSIDSAPSRVRSFAERFNIHYPLVRGDNHIEKLYGGVPKVPTTVVIDRNSRVRYMLIGAVPESDLKGLVDPLLAAEE